MKNLFRKLLSDKSVEKSYASSGARFGCDASDVATMGECFGFEVHLNAWAKWEQEYARRGYKTVSIDDFIEMGGYGKNINNLLGIKRKADEKIVLHAELYRKHYLGKINPEMDLDRMIKDGKPQMGNYIPPSTRIFEEQVK